MKRELAVKSTVIDWQDKVVEIMDTSKQKHTIPLDKTITVTMVGHPAREQKTMLARELAPYMERGYIIERIDFEEGEFIISTVAKGFSIVRSIGY